jgi:Ca-activated chloride channel family protein
MKSLVLITAIAILTMHAVFAQAIQQPAPQRQKTNPAQSDDDTITIDAALVNTYVSVRDKRGRPVPGLTKDDFTVLDDGKEEPIIYFSEESNQPLRLALVLDRSRSVEKVMGLAQAAAHDFFSSLLSPGRDSACVVTFDSGVYLAQDFTDDPAALARAVSGLTAAGGTSIFDAIYKTSRDKLSRTDQARRVILLITDGDDTTSRASIEQATQMAVENNVTVYALRLPHEHSLNSRDLRGKPVLDRLTETTGGRQVYFDGDKVRVAGFFNAMLSEMRSQYSIGYRFQSGSSMRSFHRITIRVKEPNLKASTRSGYYSGTE